VTSRSITLALTLLFCFGLQSAQAFDNAPYPPLQGTVTWVSDGDTLKIEPHGKVRLIGIDTPERDASQRDRFFIKQGISEKRLRRTYRNALQFNIDTVKGKRVTLSLDREPRDRHGRLLAYIHLPDGRLLNQVLLEQGLAVVYRRFEFDQKETFLAAESLARQEGLGLWQNLDEPSTPTPYNQGRP
jgi:micrococcal nuclease